MAPTIDSANVRGQSDLARGRPSAGPASAIDRPQAGAPFVAAGSRHGSPSRAGLVIVAVAALVRSVNQMSASIVGKPAAMWLVNFQISLWVNSIIGLAILFAAVWARERHPASGRSQYVAAFKAVLAATLLVVLALEVEIWLGIVVLLVAIWVHHNPRRSPQAAAIVAVTIVVGAAIYEPEPFPRSLLHMLEDLMRFGVVGMVIAAAWLYTCTEADHAAAIAQCGVDAARMDAQTAEAQLQVLEAQIEPHFLFNTLAHVRRLYETDRDAGGRMLRNLQAYLGVALPQMRASGSTLGRELDHATAYLDIQKIRMGRRLTYAVDVPHELRSARVPPLMLLTLVENAIKHGLTPVPAGGRVNVRACLGTGQVLRVEVADTGGGFTKAGGQGTGLANIRARLVTQFGRDANLDLRTNLPSGVVATLALPYASMSSDVGPA